MLVYEEQDTNQYVRQIAKGVSNMLNLINKTLRNNKGFTLVELVIVLVILGILALLVIPNIGGFQDTAEQRTCVSSQRTIESAAAAYYAENNSWPTLGELEDAGLVESTNCPGDGTLSIDTATGSVSCSEHARD